MAMNRIQFQPGLSLPAFLQQFGVEAQCEDALEQVRWPHRAFAVPAAAERSIAYFTLAPARYFNAGPFGSKLR
ncbi:MAG: transposase, IS1595 family [Methylococcaceae bacterium NSM2-1]|jgi:hypothetical protein|nr:MAG: transposase, IS1595 family [Methylococcaceae bacterium NSM2-1]